MEKKAEKHEKVERLFRKYYIIYLYTLAGISLIVPIILWLIDYPEPVNFSWGGIP